MTVQRFSRIKGNIDPLVNVSKQVASQVPDTATSRIVPNERDGLPRKWGKATDGFAFPEWEAQWLRSFHANVRTATRNQTTQDSFVKVLLLIMIS
jgi:hypothetical protein